MQTTGFNDQRQHNTLINMHNNAAINTPNARQNQTDRQSFISGSMATVCHKAIFPRVASQAQANKMAALGCNPAWRLFKDD
jgi:hypothetical protein